MTRHNLRPPELGQAPFLGREALRRGLLTAGQLRGPTFRRLSQGIFVDADCPDSHRIRAEGVALILPEGAAITGRSAACLDGLSLAEPNDPVHVLVQPGTRLRRRGCSVVSTEWLPAAHIRPGSPPVTIHTRTAWEVASEPDLIEAVAGLDALFRAQHPRREVMDAWVAKFPDSQAARAIALSDVRAESPQESRVRVRLMLAGFPAPEPQFRVWLSGRYPARLDFAWPKKKVAVEYDGLWHGEAQQIEPDRERLTALVDAGWRVYFLTNRQLKDPARFEAFCAKLRRGLAA
ncbi:endonuclease domain-containing protein [Cryptosporangium sp. NPDC048952]|uniref:endonuclease domain-containing protein n=1 Tax=Cryptosporangium sp. NPDC048952 TaxID=3363961 RepID=UPI003720A6B8